MCRPFTGSGLVSDPDTRLMGGRDTRQECMFVESTLSDQLQVMLPCILVSLGGPIS